MPIPELFHTCHQMLRELRPEERVTRIRNFSWLMVGLYESRSVHLSKVAEKIPGRACLPSLTRRMRRLLEIVDAPGHYSLGELDARLRTGQLDIREALPVWEREVVGVIEKRWGQAWRRFAVILLVGGGAIVLKDYLPYRFNGKAFIQDDPVISISRGLYKLGCMRVKNGRK